MATLDPATAADKAVGRGDDLFAEQLIASYVDDPAFTPRPWLADQLETAAGDEGCRLVLLEAEPGAGKTAVLASLARAHPGWLRFFLRRDSRLPWSSGDVRSFLFTVGHQLAARQPQLFRSHQLQVTVEQIVDRVEPGGHAVGISVGDLTVSPFYRTALRALQHVSLLEGSLEGLSVGRLTVEERLLEVGNLQYLALLAPGEALQRVHPHEHLVVVVDALDEVIQSVAADGPNILTWLATCPALPSNLRFILASRPNPDILEPLQGRYGDQLRLLHIDPRAAQVRTDLTGYAHRFVKRQRIAAALDQHRLTRQGFVGKAVGKADGNFQYLAALFAALDHAVGRGDDESVSAYLRLDELPTSLVELYAFLLDGIRRAVRNLMVDRPGVGLYDPPVSQPAWQGLYQPILGVLTVAERPLVEQQLARFVSLSASNRWFLQAVEAFTPLLRRGVDGITLYHASFAEFLSAEHTQIEYPQLYVDPAEWRRSIVRSYRADANRWEDVAWADVDDYGLLTLARHLHALAAKDPGSPYADELDALLCAPLMREKHRRFASYRPFADDVRLSISLAVAGTPMNGAVLLREIRGRYMLALFDALASAVPIQLIMVLVRLGEVSHALTLADVRVARIDRARVYLAIGTALVRMGGQDGRVLIEQALDLLNPAGIDGGSEPAQDLGDRLATAAVSGGLDADEVNAAAAALRREPTPRKEKKPSQPSLAEQARLFINQLPLSAAEVSHAREAATRATATPEELAGAAYLAVHALVNVEPASPARLDELSTLAGLLARARDRARLAEALDLALLLDDDIYGTRANTWAAFATACATLDDRDGLSRLLEAAEDEPDNTYRSTVLHSLAHAWGMVGDESGIAAVIHAIWQLDPAFVSPVRVLIEVPAGALDGGHQDLARRCALELIEQLEGVPDDPEMRVRLLHDIAAALVDVGQKRPAASICHEAVPITVGFVEMSGASQGLGYSGMGDRALALGDLAEELGRCGDADGAWTVGLQALEAAATSLARRQVCQAVGLRFARAMAAAGSSQQVRDAIQLTGQASGPHWVAEIVMADIGLTVAPLLHAAGEGREASAYLEFASHVVGGLDGDEADDLQGNIAIALDETGEPEEALQALERIQDPFVRASSLRYLAQRRADDGNPDQGARLAHRSLDGLQVMNRLIDRIDTQAGAAYALARCGVIQAARDLAATALEDLTSLDSQWHARPLGAIAATAVLTDDRVTADGAFALATNDFKASDDPYPLVEVVKRVTYTGRSPELERIRGLVDELANPGLAQDLNGPVIGAYLDMNDLETGLRIWRSLLSEEQLANLPALTRTLNRGVHGLAILDRGQTLIEVHRALSEVRGWWPSRQLRL